MASQLEEVQSYCTDSECQKRECMPVHCMDADVHYFNF